MVNIKNNFELRAFETFQNPEVLVRSLHRRMLRPNVHFNKLKLCRDGAKTWRFSAFFSCQKIF